MGLSSLYEKREGLMTVAGQMRLAGIIVMIIVVVITGFFESRVAARYGVITRSTPGVTSAQTF
jgi:hypothetical protein